MDNSHVPHQFGKIIHLSRSPMSKSCGRVVPTSLRQLRLLTAPCCCEKWDQWGSVTWRSAKVLAMVNGCPMPSITAQIHILEKSRDSWFWNILHLSNRTLRRSPHSVAWKILSSWLWNLYLLYICVTLGKLLTLMKLAHPLLNDNRHHYLQTFA